MIAATKLVVTDKILAVREAQKTLAEQSLTEAVDNVSRCDDAQTTAENQLESAVEEWTRYLTSDALAPELMRALGERLVDRQTVLQTAIDASRAAENNRNACASQLAERACEREVVDRIRRETRLDIVREREDRAQTAIEERTSFNWRRK